MAPRKQKAAQATPALPPQLAAINLHAAGIDIGAEAHFVAVPPSDDPQPVRSFGAYTADLEALAAWLALCGITTVALESPGVYWIPLFELLETRGFEVLLVDPQQVQKIRGRPKSDVHDCQWIQRLHTFGLLASAFRPTDQVCVLRNRDREKPHSSPLPYHLAYGSVPRRFGVVTCCGEHLIGSAPSDQRSDW
jgi:transposase